MSSNQQFFMCTFQGWLSLLSITFIRRFCNISTQTLLFFWCLICSETTFYTVHSCLENTKGFNILIHICCYILTFLLFSDYLVSSLLFSYVGVLPCSYSLLISGLFIPSVSMNDLCFLCIKKQSCLSKRNMVM